MLRPFKGSGHGQRGLGAAPEAVAPRALGKLDALAMIEALFEAKRVDEGG